VAKYEVLIKASAAKELEEIGTKRDRRRIAAHIQELAKNPHPPRFQKLSGADKYRIRCGNYGIVYSINEDDFVVQIVKIGHRREVYR